MVASWRSTPLPVETAMMLRELYSIHTCMYIIQESSELQQGIHGSCCSGNRSRLLASALQPLARRLHGDARHVHGSAGHIDRPRGAAAHRRDVRRKHER